MCPSRTRRVSAASAARTVNDSNVISSVGSGTVWKWSKAQSDSNPRSSAWCASSIVRAHAAAGSQPSYSPFQPCGAINPTCIASPRFGGSSDMVVGFREPRVSATRDPYPRSMTTFDPREPLAPAPDPWEEMPEPSIRSGPPWHMTEMIAAEPFLAERLLDRLADPEFGAGRLAGAIGQAASSGAPIVVTGCGTSEHAAQGAADILRAAIRAAGLPAGPATILAAQAFELALDPPTGGLVIGVSHEGGSRATIDAMDAAGDAGARIGLITGAAGSPAGDAADEDLIVETVEMDQGWCHTIGYVAPLVAAAAIGADLSNSDPGSP